MKTCERRSAGPTQGVTGSTSTRIAEGISHNIRIGTLVYPTRLGTCRAGYIGVMVGTVHACRFGNSGPGRALHQITGTGKAGKVTTRKETGKCKGKVYTTERTE